MKKLALGVLSLFFIFFTGVYLYGFFNTSKSPDLNKCIKASVSGKTLCDKSLDYVSLDKVSPYFLDAVVMSEDDKFYSHRGFDWKELRRSIMVNLRSFSFVRGGSTITQQLVKNVYLDQSKSLTRKIKEAFIAKKIEEKYSKKLILEKYINAIQFGDDIWGIKQASNHYFGMHPEDLGVLESLYLAILLPSPIKYSRSYEKGELTSYQARRIRNLLKRLVRRGSVDPDYAEFLFDDIENFPWGGKSLFDPSDMYQ
jgi:monofunctional biosynthetic peptidoglycan transglycosylase